MTTPPVPRRPGSAWANETLAQHARLARDSVITAAWHEFAGDLSGNNAHSGDFVHSFTFVGSLWVITHNRTYNGLHVDGYELIIERKNPPPYVDDHGRYMVWHLEQLGYQNVELHNDKITGNLPLERPFWPVPYA